MTIDSYIICRQIADALKSIILSGNEINDVQIYSESNFGVKSKVYNQIATNKTKYTKPYIAINEIGQSEKSISQIQIDIDIAVPIDADEIEAKKGITEVEVDGVIEYKNYSKLSEFANEIIKRLETKGHVCYNATQKLFRPNEIVIGTDEYSGTIQITYEFLTPISRST